MSSYLNLHQWNINLRGHSLKIFAKDSRLEIKKKKYFSHRVMKSWNMILQSVVEAPTANAFKNRLDQVQMGAL